MSGLTDQLRSAGVFTAMFETTPLKNRIAALGAMFRSEKVVFHSPYVLSFDLIMISWLLGKRPIGLTWDLYPVTLAGQRYDKRLRRRFFDIIERAAMTMCRKNIVPSRDFMMHNAIPNPKLVKIWNTSAAGSSRKVSQTLLCDKRPARNPLCWTG